MSLWIAFPYRERVRKKQEIVAGGEPKCRMEALCQPRSNQSSPLQQPMRASITTAMSRPRRIQQVAGQHGNGNPPGARVEARTARISRK